MADLVAGAERTARALSLSVGRGPGLCLPACLRTDSCRSRRGPLAETLGAKPETRASRRTDGQQEQEQQQQQQRWSISSTGPGHFRISWLHDALLDGNNLRHRLRRRLIHSLLVQQSAVRQQSTSSCAGCRKRQTNACVCVCVCVLSSIQQTLGQREREREREKQLVPLGYQINSRLQKCGGFFFLFSLQ